MTIEELVKWCLFRSVSVIEWVGWEQKETCPVPVGLQALQFSGYGSCYTSSTVVPLCNQPTPSPPQCRSHLLHLGPFYVFDFLRRVKKDNLDIFSTVLHNLLYLLTLFVCFVFLEKSPAKTTRPFVFLPLFHWLALYSCRDTILSKVNVLLFVVFVLFWVCFLTFSVGERCGCGWTSVTPHRGSI